MRAGDSGILVTNSDARQSTEGTGFVSCSADANKVSGEQKMNQTDALTVFTLGFCFGAMMTILCVLAAFGPIIK